jgi:hypothetical protein
MQEHHPYDNNEVGMSRVESLEGEKKMIWLSDPIFPLCTGLEKNFVIL